jgi:hypothetical protein
MKQEINNLLTSYGLPLVSLIMLLGVIVGIANNWTAINDSSGSGRRKEGLLNVLYTIAYVVLGIAVITGAMTLLGNLRLSV